jgi:cobalt-zinc-cadmium efflux system outer membrane protein
MPLRFGLAGLVGLATVSGLLLSQPAHAQTAAPVTASALPGVRISLAQALERFRSVNLRLVAAKYEVSAARADVIAAGLLPNPRISLGAAFKVHGESEGAARSYQVQLAQSLPIWGRLGASREAATLTANAVERELMAEAWSLLADVRRAYLAVQLAEGRHAVLSAGLADLEQVQRVLDARAAAGANPVYDRVRLEVERGSSRARLAQSLVEVAQARADLAATIGGVPSSEELRAADPRAEPAGDGREVMALVRRALEHRHEVAASRLQSVAAEARVRATRKRYLPEPELGIGYQRWTDIAGLPSSSVGGALLASASLAVPLFDRGQGTVERELKQSSAARVRERETKLTIAREVELALRKLQLTTNAYVAYREQTGQQAAQVRKIAEVTYREGRGTILELLDAYNSSLRVGEQALELRGAALAAGVELAFALGPE